MLSHHFTAVLTVESIQDLKKAVNNFAVRLGFDRFCAMAISDHLNGVADFRNVNNTPAEYLDSWQDRAEARRDPVMQHCKRSSRPIAWNQATYISADCGDKWETQAKHGYKAGLALALHLPRGRHFFIGLDRDEPLPQDVEEVTRMVAELQLFAVQAHEAAHRVLMREVEQHAMPSLTRRELESLRWTMEGKTAWEVGRILGISEQTVSRHLNSATHKLQCMNKHHAVLRALDLGLMC